jgi:hypothetical protein
MVAARTRDARVREVSADDFARLDAAISDLSEVLAAAGQGRRIWAFGDLMILKLTGRPRLGRGRVGLDKERSRKVSWASL